MTAALIMKLVAPETNGQCIRAGLSITLQRGTLPLLATFTQIDRTASVNWPTCAHGHKDDRDVAQGDFLLMILSAFVSALHTLYQTPVPTDGCTGGILLRVRPCRKRSTMIALTLMKTSKAGIAPSSSCSKGH